MTLETREFAVRDIETDAREVVGIAVPYGQTAQIGNEYRETFAPGAVQDSNDALLYWRHDEPIGRVVEAEDTEGGWMIRARISETPRGNEAYTLLRDGVIDRFSVGFEPGEHEHDRETNTVTRTKVRVREVSLVPFPAYDGATVAEVRNETPKESTVTEPNTDVEEIRESVELLERKIDTLTSAPAEPVADTRSAGEILKAVAAGDADTIRAYEGGTTADSVVKDAWVGDLTRLIDEASALRGLFATGTLPAEGLNVEFAELDTDASAAAVQANEGDDLVFGKVSLKTRTAPVATVGGYTQLTRQEIERSSVNILDANLRGQAIALGKALNTRFRAEYIAAVAAATQSVEIAAGADAYDYIEAIIDAAGIFDDNGLSLDGLVADKATFKALARLEGADGRPMLTVSGTGANTVGTLNPKGITGSVAGVTVNVDPKLDGSVAFYNRNAIREFKSPVVRLQDENIINLSKDFSLYTYTALAREIPTGLVRLDIAA